MNENERAVPTAVAEGRPRRPSDLKEAGAIGLGQEISFIAQAPENQVVLSNRLEYLAREVGGCQTDQVLALVRRIMFEVISQRKY